MGIYSQKSKISIKIIFALISLTIIVLLILNNMHKKERQSNLDFQHKLLHNLVGNILLSISSKYVIELDKIVNDQILMKYFFEQNREKFSAQIVPIYEKLKKENPHVKILTFRTIEGETFFRAHKPDLYADSISKKREIILDTLNERKKLFGFEVGKLEMAYRVTTPIFYNGILQGTLEIGIHPQYLGEKIGELSKDIDVSFLIYDKYLNTSIQKDKKKNFTIFEEGNFFTNALQNRNFLEKNNVFYQDKSEDKSYFLEADISLENHNNIEIGKLLLAWDITKKVQNHENLQLNIIISVLLIALLVLLYVHNTIKQFLVLIDRANNTLEEKVASKTEELRNLNETLEQKVQEEIEKNRDKELQLLQQSRLAQMGEMLSMIAHQWRQPLSSIASAANAMSIKMMMGKYQKEYFEEKITDITQYTQHLSQTIDDFRSFSVSDNKLKETTAFETIVEAVLKIVTYPLKSRGITVVKNFEQTMEFHSYSNELKQVILNFIKNSEDVLKEKKIKNPTITFQTLKNEDAFIFRFSDNAGGIDTTILPQIFDPYFTTKSKKNGTGLGLYMSKVIIEEHCGWKLDAYNNDEGAVFEITIPLETSQEK